MTDADPTFTFLSVEDVLSLHEDAIDAWGGTHGIRAQNQPFLDGNKRAGLGAAAAFLFVNGIDLGDRARTARACSRRRCSTWLKGGVLSRVARSLRFCVVFPERDKLQVAPSISFATGD